MFDTFSICGNFHLNCPLFILYAYIFPSLIYDEGLYQLLCGLCIYAQTLYHIGFLDSTFLHLSCPLTLLLADCCRESSVMKGGYIKLEKHIYIYINTKALTFSTYLINSHFNH